MRKRSSIFAASGIIGLGYRDFGTAVPALTLWPLYLGWCLWNIEGSICDRAYFMSLFVGMVCYMLTWWVQLHADPDLSNLIMRAAVLGFICSIICGMFLGSWG